MEFSLPLILAIVFAINIIPAFMPPTWVFLAYVYLMQGGNILLLAFLGAIFSTIGRIALAKWSGPLISGLLKNKKEDIEFAKKTLDKRPRANFLFTFLYALSPFPSNAIFIISGTAKIKLIPIASGFFLGRLISYYALLQIANFTMETVKINLSLENPIMIALDIIGILISIWIFTIDWKKILEKIEQNENKKQN